jgi:N-acetylmuramoyl-L-alanine amidase
MASAEGRARARGVETYFLSAEATDPSALAVAARENADRGAADEAAADPVAGILSSLGDVEALAESSRLAHAVHEAVVLGTGAANLGVKQAPFHVLAGARMASVLMELGFVSHPEEARLLASAAYQERLAAAIAEGVAAFRFPGRAAPPR